jgi:hypothetical protein
MERGVSPCCEAASREATPGSLAIRMYQRRTSLLCPYTRDNSLPVGEALVRTSEPVSKDAEA